VIWLLCLALTTGAHAESPGTQFPATEPGTARGASEAKPVPATPTKTARPQSNASKEPKKSGAKPSQGSKAPAKAKVKELPKLLADVQVKYIRAGTLTADFVQVNKTAAMGTTKTSSGTIQAKRPDKMRWETLKPEKNLLVSNGVKFWFYTPPFEEGERGQLIERKSSQVQSKLANALLSGSFSDLSDMKMKQSGPSEFTLSPKKGTAGTIVKAILSVDAEKSLIQQVKLIHGNGNESEITLQNIELGTTMKDSLFEFEAPTGTDRLDE
jgi:outer membrane lipoprotein carrier protein